MRAIKKFVHRIEEELEDAKEYAEDYIEQKVKGNTAMANRYKEMSNDELKHAGYIHEMAVKEIEEISAWISEVRKELKKKIIRKQESEQKNKDLYAFMHDIFGPNVIEMFDIQVAAQDKKD